MKFKKMFKLMADFFRENEMDYALIGAFALNAYGYMRATGDIDFIVRRENQNVIIAHLESLGFETIHRSTGYSNHAHKLSGLGQIDFVYVTGQTAAAVFGEARRMPVLGDLNIQVAKPEHLVALKVFAIKNDPSRRLREMADIEYLLHLPDVKMVDIRKYFEKYGQLTTLHEIVGEKGMKKNA